MKAIFLLSLILAATGIVSGAWVARHGLTGGDFQILFNDLTSAAKNYRLTSLTGYNEGANVRFACIFDNAPGVSFYARFGMLPVDLVSYSTTYRGQGFRMTSISAYTEGGLIKYAAIWEKIVSAYDWQYEKALTSVNYQTKFNTYTSQGYRLVFVNTVSLNNVDYYAAIFDKSPATSWAARHRLTSTQYQAEFNLRVGQGMKLVAVSGCRATVNGVNDDYYAALFVKPFSGHWAARHGTPVSWYQGVFENLRYQGYIPKYINAFGSGAASKFNTIWENTVMSLANIQNMDSAINSYLNTQGVTGLSFGVMLNERLVFAKSYGTRHVNTGEPLSPIHSMRIMSISKTVTAFAINRLLQSGLLTSLGRKIFGVNSIFGSSGVTYTYPNTNKANLESITVDMLLRHRAGLRTCNGEAEFWNSASTHTQTMQMLLNDASLFTSTPNTAFLYSNTGFFFLARVIEKLSGQTYQNYVRNNVLNQCGVGQSMYVGNADGTINPALECSYNPVQFTNMNMQMWDGFGGWVARPIDLLKVFARMNGETTIPDLITTTNLNAMRSDPTGMNYGQGLVLGSSGQFGHNGCHGSSRSFLWRYAGGLSYAVILNSKPSNDGCAWTLKSSIQSALDSVTQWPTTPYSLF